MIKNSYNGNNDGADHLSSHFGSRRSTGLIHPMHCMTKKAKNVIKLMCYDKWLIFTNYAVMIHSCNYFFGNCCHKLFLITNYINQSNDGVLLLKMMGFFSIHMLPLQSLA